MLRILVLNFLLAASQAKNLLNVQTIGNLEKNSFLKNLKISDIAIDPINGNNDTNLPPIISKQSGSCSNANITLTSSVQLVTLRSSNYPNDYPFNTECNYTFSSPGGTQMKFSCDDFNVACDSDFLYYSLSGSEEARACGSGSLPEETTSGNRLSIRFHSGSSRPLSWDYYRFRCTISTVSTSKPTTTTPPTPTTSPPPSCTCGNRNPNGARIVGGTSTLSGEIPWRVLLSIDDFTCGGTIISPNWVLTAAHCTANYVVDQITVYVGVQANPTSAGGGTPLTVDKIIQHPYYADENTQVYNDIALLHMAVPIKYAPNVSPACLPFSLKNFNLNGSTVLASGWGTTKPLPSGKENTDPVSNTLLKVNLTALSTEECSKYMPVTQNQLCTYNPGLDTCQGDSGGSIDYRSSRNGKYYSVGIVSYGRGCAQVNKPGVYTKVTNYLSWIQDTTKETYCML